MNVRRPRVLRRPGRDAESGAVAVEAALITPILIALVFGMVDLSLLIKDNIAVVSAVRAGARVASAEAAVPNTGSDAATVPGFAADTVATMNRSTTNLDRLKPGQDPAAPAGTVLYLSVVRGGQAPMDLDKCDATPSCLRYTWNGTSFVHAGGTWRQSTINSCPISSTTNPAGPDAIRVTVRSPHAFFTPVFSGMWDIEDSATLNFEPQPASSCAASP